MINEITKIVNVINEINLLNKKENIKKVLKLSIEMRNRLEKAMKKQRKNYNLWTLKKLKYAHEEFKEVFSDKKQILEKYLSNIDNRFLTYEVHKAYDDVFGLVYSKLNKEEKLEISKIILEKRKCSINNF